MGLAIIRHTWLSLNLGKYGTVEKTAFYRHVLQPAVASKIEYFNLRLPEDGADVYRHVLGECNVT
jgi:hypothetical protein